MAGHSKWHNIKHRKAAVDARRGKVWTKCVKAIIVAAKNGGGDPASNLALRYAIDEARYANVPRDTIERAVRKGTGEGGSEHYEPARYEGYGPGGVAVIVDALTDNRTRTVADIRNIFTKYGGNLGASGCVAFLFETRGVILAGAGGRVDDAVMEIAIEAGATDAQAPGGPDDAWTITTAPADFQGVKEAVEKAGLAVREARIELTPTTTVVARGEQAKSLIALVDALEDNDDVQKVYANFDVPESELAALEG